VTGFTLFPLAVHTAMFFSFIFLFQKEMGCRASTLPWFSFSFLFLSYEKVCSNTARKAMVDGRIVLFIWHWSSDFRHGMLQ